MGAKREDFRRRDGIGPVMGPGFLWKLDSFVRREELLRGHIVERGGHAWCDKRGATRRLRFALRSAIETNER